MIPTVKRKVEMELNYQNYIEVPPVTPKQMYGQACSNDDITINTWRNQWISQAKINREYLGSFEEHGVGKLFGKHAQKPVVLAGSGPSLVYNGHLLKQIENEDIVTVSCLHNFHYFIDNDVKIDYYVSLDAGDIVLKEVSEGGTKTEEEYWEATKDCTLIAYISSYPELLKKWRGKIYVFNAPVPDKEYEEAMEQLEPFHANISSGGNVLGASMYFSKAILGCGITAFVGADFSFSYNNKFHGWDTDYDKNIGRYIKAVDIFGNTVKTWQSYANFATWFNYIAQNVPGVYINCTEGGIFGAYPEGNIMAIKQMELQRFINMCTMYREMEEQMRDPSVNQKKILF